MSIKKISNYYTLDFIVYLQITFEKHSILHPLDREEPLKQLKKYFLATNLSSVFHHRHK